MFGIYHRMRFRCALSFSVIRLFDKTYSGFNIRFGRFYHRAW